MKEFLTAIIESKFSIFFCIALLVTCVLDWYFEFGFLIPREYLVGTIIFLSVFLVCLIGYKIWKSREAKRNLDKTLEAWKRMGI